MASFDLLSEIRGRRGALPNTLFAAARAYYRVPVNRSGVSRNCRTYSQFFAAAKAYYRVPVKRSGVSRNVGLLPILRGRRGLLRGCTFPCRETGPASGVARTQLPAIARNISFSLAPNFPRRANIGRGYSLTIHSRQKGSPSKYVICSRKGLLSCSCKQIRR